MDLRETFKVGLRAEDDTEHRLPGVQPTGHQEVRIIRGLCQGGQSLFLGLRAWQGKANQQGCPSHLDNFS